MQLQRRLQLVFGGMLFVALLLALAPAHVHVAEAKRAHDQQSISLSTLPFTTDAGGATALSAASPGHFYGHTLTSGIQVGHNCRSSARFNLGGHYDWLSGRLYEDDATKTTGGTVAISDATHLAQPRNLFVIRLDVQKRIIVHIPVTGINVLSSGTLTCAGLYDFVGTVGTGTFPSTQVVPRYPIGNSVFAAGSKVFFGWQPYPTATSYLLRVWLQTQNGGFTIKDTTPTAFIVPVFGKTTFSWSTGNYVSGVYGYDLLPRDELGNALGDWSLPQTVVISSD